MKNFLKYALLTLIAALVLTGNVSAREAEYVELEDGFEDSVVNCRLIGAVYQEDFDKFANGEFSTKGVQWQEFVYNIRFDSTLYCGSVTSTVPSDKFALYENELTDAAYKFMTAYELRLTAIENTNNPAVNALADKVQAKAEELYVMSMGDNSEYIINFQ